MVLINELTVEQINAALLHLQRSKDEVVGGNKGTTIQNITISNSGGGGNNVDYSGTIKNLATNIEKNKTAIEKNTSDIAKLKSDFSNIEKSVEDTLQGLVDNGISDLSYDPLTKQLTITTNDGDTFQTTITQDIGVLSYDSATNKLILTTGEQTQEITLPYIKAGEKGSANGVATLDENGRVPYSQLPESAMEFLGQWDASTNTPHLQDGTGTNGDFYIVSAGGTVNLGTAQNPRNVTFSINDRAIYEGDIAQWVRLPAGQVSSVNGQSGAVTLTATDIEYSTGVSIKAKIDANAVQADWNVSDTTSLAYIKNKPTIPAAQVQSDWTQTCSSCKSYIQNKPTLATVATSGKYCDLTGKPTIPASPVQSDWNVTDTTSLAYIKNKPTIPSTPTLVCCAKCVYLDSFTANADRPVMVACPRGTTGYSDQGVSTCCCFTFNPATGVLRVNCLCGEVEYADKSESSCMACCVKKTKYPTSCNCDLNIMMVSSVPGSSNDFAQGYAQGCCLTYNPSTGQLRLKSNGKTACISHINASYLHIYTDAPAIAFNQDVYLPDGKYICRAKETCYVRDRLNGTATYLAYGCAGLTSNPTWLAAWNGYELRAISPANVCVGCANVGLTTEACKAKCSCYRPICAKWCVVCCQGQTIRYLRMAFCSSTAGTFLVIPGSSLWYCGACFGCYPTPEIVALSANTWSLRGCCYCVANSSYNSSCVSINGIMLY